MTVATLTFGCRLNISESTAMQTLASGPALIVNTCAVTAEAERQARKAIRAAHRADPARPIIVTGCAAQLDPASWAALPGVARVIGNADKLRAQAWGPAPLPMSDAMAARDIPIHPVTGLAGRTRAFVQVQTGCDHRCTFCIIPFGRGPSRSVPAGALVQQLRALVEAGCREAVLTGVDIAAWGADLPGAPSLGSLARRILRLVPDLPRLRLSSLDPVEADADLLALLADEPRLLPHLHLSLQHGDDLILKRMKRRHTRADADAFVARARALRPGLTLGADLIAGFPTETDAAHRRTLAMIEDLDIAFPHVFPYSERASTPAARMPSVPIDVRRARAAELRAAGQAQAARHYASRIGHLESVLFERGNRGHTEQFAPLRLVGASIAPGTLRAVRVTAAAADGLLADLA